VLAPTEQIDQLRAAVEALYALGTLNRGKANSLWKKLEHAQSEVDRGNSKVAYNVIGAFRNEVAGLLPPDQGEPLLALAESLLQSLQVGGGF
jgi:hypothetical protein